MSYGYRNRARIVPRPPSFLEAFLYSTGIGMNRGIDQYYKDRDRKRGITNQILESVLEGNVSPELLATDLGQSLQRQIGIDKEPVVKKITQMGREEFSYPERTEELPGGAVVKMPGVVPPEIPFAVYRGRQEATKERQGQAKMRGELYMFEEKEKIKRRQERAFRMPLSKRVEVATDALKNAKKNNVPIEDLTIRDPETGINLNFLTYLEDLQKQKTEGIAKTKGGIAYLKEELKYHNLLMSSVKFLHGLKSDEGVTEDMSDLGKELLRGIGISGRALSPEEVKVYTKRFLPIINQKLEVQHKILRRQKFMAKDPNITLPFMKQFKLSEALNPERYASEFEVIKAYTDLTKKSDQEALRDVATKEAKLRESLSVGDVREVVIPPGPAEQQSNSKLRESINTIAQQIISERWTDPETNLPYTMEQAREFAKEYLKRK